MDRAFAVKHQHAKVSSDENLTEVKDSDKIALITGITGQDRSYL